jgi:hypothetical protein
MHVSWPAALCLRQAGREVSRAYQRGKASRGYQGECYRQQGTGREARAGHEAGGRTRRKIPRKSRKSRWGLVGGPGATEELAEACYCKAEGQSAWGQLAAKAGGARRAERRWERESGSATVNAERLGAHECICDHY